MNLLDDTGSLKLLQATNNSLHFGIRPPSLVVQFLVTVGPYAGWAAKRRHF